jgi:hypothetical protein
LDIASSYHIGTSLFFCWQYIAKKAILRIKSAKIKCFLRFSIAIIRSKFKKNHQISIDGNFYRWVKRVAKSIEGCLKNLFSYLACSQIWLNLLVDHHHFGYIRKLTKKILIGTNNSKENLIVKEKLWKDVT